MSTTWITTQILAIRRAAEPARVAASRPRGAPGSVIAAGSAPAGVMREGSATHAVWTYLHARRERMPGWVTRQQIVVAVGRHHKAVDWALTFLRAVRLVEASQDARCSRYLRYRAIKGGGRGLTNKPVYERLRALADRADAGHKLTRADALLLRHAAALIEQHDVLMDGASERERNAISDACSAGALVRVLRDELRALVEHVERHSGADES